jgi:hypothetical protein
VTVERRIKAVYQHLSARDAPAYGIVDNAFSKHRDDRLRVRSRI